MLDIKFIRENKDIVKAGAQKKHIKVDIDALLLLDNERRLLLASIETKRAEQNKFSEKFSHVDIVHTGASAASPEDRATMKTLKDAMQVEDEKLKEVMKKWQELMLQVPMMPDMSVPEGDGEEQNQEVSVWGEKPKFSFPAKDHIELLTSLDMVDFERGVKAHGFRGYFLKKDGAELSWALWNYAREFYMKKNFEPFIAPAVLRKKHFYATGHLPKEAEDLYKTQDDDYLSGTAEVAMMAYHSDEILDEKDLPRRYLAFSPCYRREAGSHSKDTKGLIRVQEFFKLEQLILAKADHADSAALHEEINRNFEEFLESLGLPYHRLLICGGDLGASKVKQYDTEVWFPSQNAYRELSSASYYHDFQTRRFNIRYEGAKEGAAGGAAGGKEPSGKKFYAYSLNCTAVATPRIIGAIAENYQQADGTIAVPEVLQKYMGGKKVISKK